MREWKRRCHQDGLGDRLPLCEVTQGVGAFARVSGLHNDVCVRKGKGVQVLVHMNEWGASLVGMR